MSNDLAYYNENDRTAAAWLRELIKAGHIAPGEVDERSIVDIRPSDLTGFSQCHFFAGVGGWSYALRRAGWADERPVWTGSCPCQPFSAAGKGGGFDDERHLWPAFFHLIGECSPAIVFGEQVASKDADPWIDLVQTDLEAVGYAFGAVPFPSAGIGAPHIRDRTYWVADASGSGREPRAGLSGVCGANYGARSAAIFISLEGSSGGLADPDSGERDGQSIIRGAERDGSDAGRSQGSSGSEPRSHALRLGDASLTTCKWDAGSLSGAQASVNGKRIGFDGCLPVGSQHASAGLDQHGTAGPTNGLWRDADWLFCRDGKWRPVEPSTFPLAHGAPARVGRLRGYGNAINAEAAAAFIEAFIGG